MNDIILVGGGGHARSVIDTLLSLENFRIAGLIDNNVGDSLRGIPVIGTDDDLPRIYGEGISHAFITVGSIGNNSIRRRLYDLLKNLGFCFPNIVDPSCVISDHITYGEGIFIGKSAVINTGCKIGNMAIINSNATADHDCVIGDFVHISPGAVLCGGTVIGANSHIGAGSVVIQGVSVGHDTIVGAGSVVVKNINAYKKAYGNPCREIKDNF